MSPDSSPQGAARSADEINEEIRAFWQGPGAHPTLPLSREQSARYHRLLAELQQVNAGDVTKAA
ncbi:hypothetical protein [Streptomyces sp. 1222.5]|uniref:hypothetical protein n=1 Tax=Streptomyces sp. 1222.5 TaxID=1881026 RepID=UPI003EC0C72A